VNIQSLITNESLTKGSNIDQISFASTRILVTVGFRRLVLPLARRSEIGEVHASKAIACWEFEWSKTGTMAFDKSILYVGKLGIFNRISENFAIFFDIWVWVNTY